MKPFLEVALEHDRSHCLGWCEAHGFGNVRSLLGLRSFPVKCSRKRCVSQVFEALDGCCFLVILLAVDLFAVYPAS
jgi:hypothetical protein